VSGLGVSRSSGFVVPRLLWEPLDPPRETLGPSSDGPALRGQWEPSAADSHRPNHPRHGARRPLCLWTGPRQRTLAVGRGTLPLRSPPRSKEDNKSNNPKPQVRGLPIVRRGQATSSSRTKSALVLCPRRNAAMSSQPMPGTTPVTGPAALHSSWENETPGTRGLMKKAVAPCYAQGLADG
jgi:hypothetical protein